MWRRAAAAHGALVMSSSAGVVRHGSYRRINSGTTSPVEPRRKKAHGRARDPHASLADALRRLRTAIAKGNVEQVRRLEARIDGIFTELEHDRERGA